MLIKKYPRGTDTSHSMSPKVIGRAVRTVYGLAFADLSPDLLLAVDVSWPTHGVFLDLVYPSAFAYKACLVLFDGSTSYRVRTTWLAYGIGSKVVRNNYCIPKRD